MNMWQRLNQKTQHGMYIFGIIGPFGSVVYLAVVLSMSIVSSIVTILFEEVFRSFISITEHSTNRLNFQPKKKLHLHENLKTTPKLIGHLVENGPKTYRQCVNTFNKCFIVEIVTNQIIDELLLFWSKASIVQEPPKCSTISFVL